MESERTAAQGEAQPLRLRSENLRVYRDRATGLNLHLRIEEDGSGILIVNASKLLFLNKTATDHVKLFMENKTVDEAVDDLMHRYRASKTRIKTDHLNLINAINSVASVDACPVSYLGFERIDPFSKIPKAPYRLDLALTYRCNNRCLHCYAGKAEVKQELSTDEWKKVIDKAFQLGIPQILFTGGEPTLRADLAELVGHAEKYGMISGLVTNGRKLADASLGEKLADAGLDFIQVTLESSRQEVHDSITQAPGSYKETVDGIRNIVGLPLYCSVNVTLNRLNVDHALEIVDFTHDLGVRRMSTNALIYAGRGLDAAEQFVLPIKRISDTIVEMRDRATEHGMRFEWYTPTCFIELNPVNLGFGIKTCTAARITMCVEPDGDVLPCQSYYAALGNVLRDPWREIWNHPLARKFRDRKLAPEKCKECPELDVCGGACPLEWQAREILCSDVSCRVAYGDRQVVDIAE